MPVSHWAPLLTRKAFPRPGRHCDDEPTHRRGRRILALRREPFPTQSPHITDACITLGSPLEGRRPRHCDDEPTHRSQEKKIVTNNEVRTFAFRRLSLHGMPPTRQAGPCIILGSGLVLNSIARCGAHHDARYEGYPASCFAASRLHAPRRVPSYHAGKPHLKGVHHVAGSATHAIAELLCATGTLTCEPQSRSRLQQARGRRGCCVRPP